MKNKILFVLCLLFGLIYINAGLNKFFNYMPMPADIPESFMKVLQAFGTIGWLMPLVGAAEIIGGVLIMIPKFRALGAIILLPLTIGILLTSIVNSPDGPVLGMIMMAINLWVIFEDRQKYMPMIA